MLIFFYYKKEAEKRAFGFTNVPSYVDPTTIILIPIESADKQFFKDECLYLFSERG